MKVVTVALLAVVRDVVAIKAGTDAADATLVPVSDVHAETLPLAFDHRRIIRDAVERVSVELEVSGVATGFLAATFTLSELRLVYEGVWGVTLDGANFRRRVLADDGWVIATGRRTRPGPAGGKPAELFRAGSAWKHGGPLRRPHSTRRGTNS
jgi:8-oxo-dGTP diphosphatase